MHHSGSPASWRPASRSAGRREGGHWFEVGPDSTRVELEHRNLERYGESAAQMRDSFDGDAGWPGPLDRFGASL